ncbi:ABC transporter permease [Clostridium sp. SHJSY1]|uniref:ABC transporter permease n=1 Tax=Clostridium sp. SHJSY1 TaxID=2942483 RepID=UPI0028746CD2|nr:ABC transporter permease [Clostridium sp. SHJSY1]MDS0525594.1 ABC transporter permease [Clostridium sp. SHJSY1]
MKNSKKRVAVLFAICAVTALLFLVFNRFYNDQPKMINLSIEVMSEETDQYVVYYDLTGDKNWSEEHSDKESYKKVNEYEKLSFRIPVSAKNIRIDFGNKKTEIKVKNLLISNSKSIQINKNELDKYTYSENNLKMIYEENGNDSIVNTTGDDPYIVIDNVSESFNSIVGRPSYMTGILIAISLILGIITGNSLKEFKNAIRFLKASVSNKKLIASLAKNDFKQKYATSYLGIIWGFINPLISILVYWFVFQFAFQQGDVHGKPYILWFVAGIIPWFFFSEALSGCTNVFLEYTYLVKKVVFKIEALPVIKIISILIVHVFFIVCIFVINTASGFYPTLSNLQCIYYSVSMVALVFCVTVFTSAVVLFFRDLGQLIAIVINVGFWATPIGWNISMAASYPVLEKLIKLNPMFYIVNGYRDSFIENIFFWQRPYNTLYFWSFCLIALLIGVKVFNKLRPHFSDVI